MNVRKGKIIPGYELNVSLSWEGEAKDSEGKTVLKAEGAVDMPYISDENADEDPEIRYYGLIRFSTYRLLSFLYFLRTL